MKLFYCFFKNESHKNNKARLRVNLNLKLWWKNFVIVNYIGCPAAKGVRAIDLKENCPRLGLGFGLGLRLRLLGNCPRTAVMPIKPKEHLMTHVYFSNDLQPFLIWSDRKEIADKDKNMCFLIGLTNVAIFFTGN